MTMDTGAELARMRDAAPLVHNITNYVSMSIMANVLLAAGASPAMVHAREEAAEFTGLANALTVNIGTLSPAWVDAMVAAADAANTAGKPWVLDPVAAGATTYRRKVAADLVQLRPTVVRGNASEILAIAGPHGAGKGVDSADDVATAEAAAREVAAQTGGIVAVTGPVDLVTDGVRLARIANGHPMLAKVTATGCTLTGVVGAFLGAGSEPFAGTAAALAYFGLAGEQAAARSSGPGSFAVALLDALAAIDPSALREGARIDLR